jgi:hypothetical protein
MDPGSIWHRNDNSQFAMPKELLQCSRASCLGSGGQPFMAGKRRVYLHNSIFASSLSSSPLVPLSAFLLLSLQLTPTWPCHRSSYVSGQKCHAFFSCLCGVLHARCVGRLKWGDGEWTGRAALLFLVLLFPFPCVRLSTSASFVSR